MSRYHLVCVLSLALAHGAMVKGYGNLPLVFEPNRGQTISQARFLARASGYDVFITADKAILTMGAAPVSMRLVGARSTAKPEAIAPLESYSNYILGNDPARWLQGVPHFAKIRVRGVLPGIDLTYYGERRKLEYDLDVAPRADTRSLKVEFTGADGLSLDADGNLLVHTKAGDIVQHKPWAWQGSKQIKAYYALLRDGAVAIRLGSYNHEQALKIDPVLSYSTYLSGSEGDGATAIAVDSGGYAYVTGITSSLDFPVTAGAFHSGPYGNAFPDIFVSKLTPSGGALVYSTFVGGSYSDQSNAIAIDPLGYVYVTGTSNSGDFPQVPGPSVYPGIPIIIVFKLDPTGVPVYSEFLGGGTALPDANDNDSGRGIAADANGNAYIVGSAGLNFTTTPGAFQPTRPTPNFTTTAFAAKLNASGGLVYSTYLTGTSGISLASAVAVDPTGNAYIVGSTSQATFPVTQGAVGTTYRGGTDAFAVKLNPSGSGLLYGTFLGGTGSDSATSVAIDSSGNAYVTGTTSSTNFPTTTGTIAPTRSGLNSNQTGFVSKLNASGSALTYSTYLGGSNTDSPSGIVVDGSGNVIVSGSTRSSDFPTTPGALKQQTTVQNGFVSQLNPAGSSLVYSTLFGTSNSESIAGIAADGAGAVYVTGQTFSFMFPATPNAFQVSSPRNPGSPNTASAFVSKIDLASPGTCNIVLSSNSANVPGYGATGSFTFTLASGCPWEATSESFISLNGLTHGFGNGTVNYTAAYNQSASPAGQTGKITVNGGTLVTGSNVFTITEAPGSCGDPSFDSNPINFSPAGGAQNVGITLPTSCLWNVVNSTPWVTITSGATGSGSGTLSLYAAPNSFGQRQGTITIAGKTVSLKQGSGACTVTLLASGTAVGGQGGTGGMTFTTSAPTCTWATYSLVPWIQLSATAGQGSGTAPFVVAANPGLVSRIGQLAIGDQTYTVTQAAGPAAIPTAYTATVFAGTGTNSFSGDGGPALLAGFSDVIGLAFDGSGNLYIADNGNQRIRVVDTSSTVNTFAGGGSANPGDGGAATAASLFGPTGVAADSSGNVYFSDGQRIREVRGGLISTFAGTGVAGFSGDEYFATFATLNDPYGLALDPAGNLYVADEGNQRVRIVGKSSGTIFTIAGTGAAGFGGDGNDTYHALLNHPTSVAADAASDIYIADLNNCRIRKIESGFLSGLLNFENISTVAGTGICSQGADNVPATQSALFSPVSVAVDSGGSIYIAESYRIRKVTPDGMIRTIFSTNYYPLNGIALDPSGNVFVSNGSVIDKLTPVPAFCTYTVTPPATIPIGGGSITVQVTTTAGCSWSAGSTLPWATLSGSASATGSGSVTFTLAANASFSARTGTVTIAGQTLTLTQKGAAANVGIFRFGYFWLLDVDGNQVFDSPPDLAFPFGGVPGDIPITGDWNGNGHTKVGIYRPTSGLFILDTNGDGVFDSGDAVYNLGVGTQPGDVPVVGDWNGDGRTKVGLFRQGFFWILDYNGNGVFEQGVDKTYAFGGAAGDVPVVGDWTGTGISKIGLVRYGYFWILDANGNGAFDGTGPGQDYAFAYGGIPGDVPVVGDWNGDGSSKVGVFRFGYFWVLDANGNFQFDGTGPGQDLAFPFGGIGGDKPVVGKW